MSGSKYAIEKMVRSTCAVCPSILCNTKILLLDTGNVDYNLRMRIINYRSTDREIQSLQSFKLSMYTSTVTTFVLSDQKL